MNQKNDPHPFAFLISKDKSELASINSRLGILKNVNANRFKKQALEKFKNNLTENYMEPKNISSQYCRIEVTKNQRSVKF